MSELRRTNSFASMTLRRTNSIGGRNVLDGLRRSLDQFRDIGRRISLEGGRVSLEGGRPQDFISEPMAEPVDATSTMSTFIITRSSSTFVKSLDVLNSYGSLTYRLRGASPTWKHANFQLQDVSRDQILWDAEFTKASSPQLSFHRVDFMGANHPKRQAHYRSQPRAWTFEFMGGFFEWCKRTTHEGGEEVICTGRVTNIYNEVSGPLLVARYEVAPSWRVGNALGTLMLYDKVPKPMEDHYFAFREFLIFSCTTSVLCFEQAS